MQIRVLPRRFFETRIGKEDAEILKRFNVISINTPFLQEKPPFSETLLTHRNLLVLHFDDVCDPADPDQARQRFMTAADAVRILNFAAGCDRRRPLLIHCTAGVSRSGAVGDFLNWYYNRHLVENRLDFYYFTDQNPGIVPNFWVKQQLFSAINVNEII